MNLFSQEEKEEWVKMLELMYENHVIVDSEVSAGMMGPRDVNQFLTPAFKFYREVEPEIEADIDPLIENLEQIGLVEVNRKGGEYGNIDSDIDEDGNVPVPGLTQEGLQFAHQIKTERQRRKTNRWLLGLTVILAVLTAFLIGIELFDIPTYSI